jgi:hypothetical protein
MGFGILTLATPNDYLKAIGLALSVKVSNPGVPIAVACSEKIRPLVEKYFDFVVKENPDLRGFRHKVHIDEYSPFDETFFFDSDVLIFRPIMDILPAWRGQPYNALGGYASADFSSFMLDRPKVLQKIGKDKLVCIDGAGHAYFKKPECSVLFELARKITANYSEYAGNIRYADEDVIDIAMTMLDYVPYYDDDFFSRYMSAKPGTMKIDAANANCSFIAQLTNKEQRPYMMHFAAREAPFAYTRQLRKLFKKFGVPTKGLRKMAWNDFYVLNIEWPLKKAIKWILRKG